MKNKTLLNIILLLLAVILPFFFGVVGVGISLALVITYYFKVSSRSKIHKLLLILSFLGAIFSLIGLISFNSMDNAGIDAIGEAIIYGYVFDIGIIISMCCPFVMLIIDYRKQIFQKKVIIRIIIIIIAIVLFFPTRYLLVTTKVDDNIPSINDFEKELLRRGFDTVNSDYRLYGISKEYDRGIRIAFDINNDDKYPLYVFSIIDYPWLIYYANGDIYAVKGKYWDYYSQSNYDFINNEEKIIWDFTNEVLSEQQKVYVYNIETNRYEKGDTLASYSFNYYAKDQTEEDSVFIDIPSIESWGNKIKLVDRVDFESLN